MDEPPRRIPVGTHAHRHSSFRQRGALDRGQRNCSRGGSTPSDHARNPGGGLRARDARQPQRVETPPVHPRLLTDALPGVFHKRVEIRELPFRRNGRFAAAIAGAWRFIGRAEAIVLSDGSSPHCLLVVLGAARRAQRADLRADRHPDICRASLRGILGRSTPGVDRPIPPGVRGHRRPESRGGPRQPAGHSRHRDADGSCETEAGRRPHVGGDRGADQPLSRGIREIPSRTP